MLDVFWGDLEVFVFRGSFVLCEFPNFFLFFPFLRYVSVLFHRILYSLIYPSPALAPEYGCAILFM